MILYMGTVVIEKDTVVNSWHVLFQDSRHRLQSFRTEQEALAWVEGQGLVIAKGAA